MEINEKISGMLPENINRILQISLKDAIVKCNVIIVVKPGESSGTKLTLTIDSPVNYDEYVSDKES
jgi:hypothetical protein